VTIFHDWASRLKRRGKTKREDERREKIQELERAKWNDEATRGPTSC
jgi:hypothetical protein